MITEMIEENAYHSATNVMKENQEQKKRRIGSSMKVEEMTQRISQTQGLEETFEEQDYGISSKKVGEEVTGANYLQYRDLPL